MTATVIRFPVERRTPSPAAAPTDGVEQAHAVLDAAARWIEHEPAEVIVLCQRGFEMLTAAGPDIDDDASLHLVAARLGELHRQAATAIGADTGEVTTRLGNGWRRCPTLTRHFVQGAEHPAGPGRSISAAVAAARRRHPTAGFPRQIG
ncbi:MAG: hypothetical protein ACK5OX_01850 [Desertimonas sp.]